MTTHRKLMSVEALLKSDRVANRMVEMEGEYALALKFAFGDIVNDIDFDGDQRTFLTYWDIRQLFAERNHTVSTTNMKAQFKCL